MAGSSSFSRQDQNIVRVVRRLPRPQWSTQMKGQPSEIRVNG